MQRILLLIACFIFCADCFAQQYPFVHYTPKDGLVNSRVRKAYQDSKGRMYFITYGGLSVYDGSRFKNYTIQEGLVDDLVNDVLEVGDDSLLVATNSSGLNVLVRGKMKRPGPALQNSPVINDFLKGRDGIVYMSTDDGLYKIGSTGFEKLSTVSALRKDPVDFLGSIAEYKDYIVFTTNDLRNFTGLFLYSKKTNTITDALLQLTVLGLRSDHHGMIWVGSYLGMHNLDTVALAAGKLELRAPYATYINPGTLAGGNVNFNSQNEPFISTDKGIIRYLSDGAQLIISTPDLPIPAMKNFFIDREDILWICHDGYGLYKLPNTKLQSTDRFFRENKSGIRAIKAFNDGSVWTTMNDREWIVHQPSGSKHIRALPSTFIMPLQNNKTHLYAIGLNTLYMAPLPKEHEATIRFKKIITMPDTIFFGGKSVADPYENIILFESRNICVIQNDKQIFTYPLETYNLVEGMYVDKRKMLWIISRKGIAIFSLHPENPSQYMREEFRFIKELEGTSPRCMTVDKNEVVWIGTRSHGLMAFEFKENQLKRLHHFKTQNGLTDNFVTAVACDSNNNIIVGTQTGIDRLIKTGDGYRFENITKSNNIFSYIKEAWTDINNNAFAMTNAGDIYQIEPVLPPRIISEPQLVIEEMKINGQSVSASASSLRLKYYQRNISLSVAAPTFIDERQVQYSYLLSGSGINEWSDTSSLADINLLNLSPGKYTLRIKAFFLSTPYSPKEIEFPFEIMPPWWQTWWFRVLAGILLLGLLLLAARYYYSNKLEKQRVVLENQQAIEKERTRIATDMHDDLGAGLSRIKFLSETIGIKKLKQEPIEDEITSIRDYSHEMIDKMGEIVWALNEKNDSLSDLLSYTRSYAVEYLSQNGIRCTVEAPEEFPSAFVSGEFRRNIYLSVKEALHNIVKHAQANSVFLSFSIRNGVHITIRDDGQGFDRKNIKPYSNGLINMQKRMKDLGGSFEIENNNGTTIKLVAPLPSPLNGKGKE